MDNGNDNNIRMKNQTSTSSSNLSMKFLQRKQQALRQHHQKRKKVQQSAQQAARKSKNLSNELQSPQKPGSKNVPNMAQINKNAPQQSKNIQQTMYHPYSQPVHSQIAEKKVSLEQILCKGEIIKVIQRTLNQEQYKIQCLYEGQVLQMLASKQEIIKNNIIPLLDFYEKILGLR